MEDSAVLAAQIINELFDDGSGNEFLYKKVDSNEPLKDNFMFNNVASEEDNITETRVSAISSENRNLSILEDEYEIPESQINVKLRKNEVSDLSSISPIVKVLETKSLNERCTGSLQHANGGFQSSPFVSIHDRKFSSLESMDLNNILLSENDVLKNSSAFSDDKSLNTSKGSNKNIIKLKNSKSSDETMEMSLNYENEKHNGTDKDAVQGNSFEKTRIVEDKALLSEKCIKKCPSLSMLLNKNSKNKNVVSEDNASPKDANEYARQGHFNYVAYTGASVKTEQSMDSKYKQDSSVNISRAESDFYKVLRAIANEKEMITYFGGNDTFIVKEGSQILAYDNTSMTDSEITDYYTDIVATFYRQITNFFEVSYLKPVVYFLANSVELAIFILILISYMIYAFLRHLKFILQSSTNRKNKSHLEDPICKINNRLYDVTKPDPAKGMKFTETQKCQSCQSLISFSTSSKDEMPILLPVKCIFTSVDGGKHVTEHARSVIDHGSKPTQSSEQLMAFSEDSKEDISSHAETMLNKTELAMSEIECDKNKSTETSIVLSENTKGETNTSCTEGAILQTKKKDANNPEYRYSKQNVSGIIYKQNFSSNAMKQDPFGAWSDSLQNPIGTHDSKFIEMKKQCTKSTKFFEGTCEQINCFKNSDEFVEIPSNNTEKQIPGFNYLIFQPDNISSIWNMKNSKDMITKEICTKTNKLNEIQKCYSPLESIEKLTNFDSSLSHAAYSKQEPLQNDEKSFTSGDISTISTIPSMKDIRLQAQCMEMLRSKFSHANHSSSLEKYDSTADLCLGIKKYFKFRWGYDLNYDTEKAEDMVAIDGGTAGIDKERDPQLGNYYSHKKKPDLTESVLDKGNHAGAVKLMKEIERSNYESKDDPFLIYSTENVLNQGKNAGVLKLREEQSLLPDFCNNQCANDSNDDELTTNTSLEVNFSASSAGSPGLSRLSFNSSDDESEDALGKTRQICNDSSPRISSKDAFSGNSAGLSFWEKIDKEVETTNIIERYRGNFLNTDDDLNAQSFPKFSTATYDDMDGFSRLRNSASEESNPLINSSDDNETNCTNFESSQQDFNCAGATPFRTGLTGLPQRSVSQEQFPANRSTDSFCQYPQEEVKSDTSGPFDITNSPAKDLDGNSIASNAELVSHNGSTDDLMTKKKKKRLSWKGKIPILFSFKRINRHCMPPREDQQ